MTDYPEKTLTDAAHSVARAVLGSVPIVGAAATELFNYVIAEPVSERREEWLKELEARLRALEAEFGEPFIDKLSDDPSFTTVVLNATQIAIRNHEQEKLDALANAVTNAALGRAPNDLERAILLWLIDQLTPAHLAILSVMRDPKETRAWPSGLATSVLAGSSKLSLLPFPTSHSARNW